MLISVKKKMSPQTSGFTTDHKQQFFFMKLLKIIMNLWPQYTVWLHFLTVSFVIRLLL